MSENSNNSNTGCGCGGCVMLVIFIFMIAAIGWGVSIGKHKWNVDFWWHDTNGEIHGPRVYDMNELPIVEEVPVIEDVIEEIPTDESK